MVFDKDVIWSYLRMQFLCEYIFRIVWIKIIDCFKNFNGQNS